MPGSAIASETADEIFSKQINTQRIDFFLVKSTGIRLYLPFSH